MADLQTIWTTKEIVSTVIATGVVSALVTTGLTNFVEFVKGRSKKKKDSTYTALRLANVLEGYAFACWDIVDRAKVHYEYGGSAALEQPPPPLSYPADIDFKAIDTKLADRAIAMSNLIAIGTSDAEYAAQFEGNKWDFDWQCQLLGEKAWRLSDALRSGSNLAKNEELTKRAERHLKKPEPKALPAA
jgi:hypothetical protein